MEQSRPAEATVTSSIQRTELTPPLWAFFTAMCLEGVSTFQMYTWESNEADTNCLLLAFHAKEFTRALWNTHPSTLTSLVALSQTIISRFWSAEAMNLPSGEYAMAVR